MMDYIASHGLDIFTTVLGLVYILLEYRASIWLWLVGIIMPALDVWLYWSHGLYGDAGMAVYYTIAGIYGYAVWKYGKKHNQKEKEELPITYMKKSLYLPTLLFFLAAWSITYYILITFTNLYSSSARQFHQCPRALWGSGRWHANISSSGSSGLS